MSDESTTSDPVELWRHAADALGRSDFEPQEITGISQYVIMRIRVSGRGKASGIETPTDLFHAWTLRDGKPQRCFVRSTREEALKAVELAG